MANFKLTFLFFLPDSCSLMSFVFCAGVLTDCCVAIFMHVHESLCSPTPCLSSFLWQFERIYFGFRSVLQRPTSFFLLRPFSQCGQTHTKCLHLFLIKNVAGTLILTKRPKVSVRCHEICALGLSTAKSLSNVAVETSTWNVEMSKYIEIIKITKGKAARDSRYWPSAVANERTLGAHSSYRSLPHTYIYSRKTARKSLVTQYVKTFLDFV